MAQAVGAPKIAWPPKARERQRRTVMGCASLEPSCALAKRCCAPRVPKPGLAIRKNPDPGGQPPWTPGSPLVCSAFFLQVVRNPWGKRPGEPKTEEVAAVAGPAPAADSGTQVPRFAAPVAAPHHPRGTAPRLPGAPIRRRARIAVILARPAGRRGTQCRPEAGARNSVAGRARTGRLMAPTGQPAPGHRSPGPGATALPHRPWSADPTAS